MRRRGELSRVRTDRLKEDMSLRERLDLICDVIDELSNAAQSDVCELDLRAFSDYGIEQIRELIKEEFKRQVTANETSEYDLQRQDNEEHAD